MAFFRLDYITQFFSLIAPIFLPLFIVFYSFMHNNFKGLIFLAGLTMAIGLGVAMKAMTKPRVNLLGTYSPMCYVADIGSVSLDGIRTMPCTNSVIIAFSIFYLIYPILIEGTAGHLPMIVILFLYMILNGITRIHLKCVRFMDIIGGWIFGAALGGVYAALIDMAGGAGMLFFTQEKDTKKCFRLSENKLRCKLVPATAEEKEKAKEE